MANKWWDLPAELKDAEMAIKPESFVNVTAADIKTASLSPSEWKNQYLQQPYFAPPAPQVFVPNPADQHWLKIIADQYFTGADTVTLTPDGGWGTFKLALKYFAGDVISFDLQANDVSMMQYGGILPTWIQTQLKGKLNDLGIKTAPDWNTPAPQTYKKYSTDASPNASFEATSLGTVMEWWANRSDIAVSRTSDGFWQVFSLSLHAIGQHWVIRGDNPAEALRKAVFYNFPNKERYNQYLKDRVGKGPSW